MERRFNRLEKQRFSDQLYNFIVQGPSYGKKIQKHLTIDHTDLRNWLESLFRKEMAWENYEKTWEIGYLAPFELFNYALSRDLDIYLSHYNLFPILKEDRKKWDIRLSLSIIEGYPANEMTMKIAERIGKEIEYMNQYIPGYEQPTLL